MALAKPKASVPPWLLMAMPLRPRNGPPLRRRGSMRSFSARKPALGQQGAELGRQRAGQGLAHIGRHLLGRAFGGLERDIAGKALDHHHIDDALADLVALDEAAVVDRQVVLLEPGMRLPHLLDALDLLHADVEQPDARPLDVQDGARAMAAPISAKSASWRAVAPILAPRSSTMQAARRVGHCPAMAGRSMPGMVRQARAWPWPSGRRCCRPRP